MIPGLSSQLDQAQRDTIVAHAEGVALRRLARFYGAPMPDTWNEAAWRKGLRAIAVGPRGFPGGTFGFVEGILSFAETTYPITRTPLTPRRITAVGGVGTWTAEHLDRWWRIGGVLYMSQGPSDPSLVDYLDLVPVTTAYTVGADWTTLAAPDAVNAVLLPFILQEPTPGPGTPQSAGKRCTVKVIVWLDDWTGVPPTYLQGAGGLARPVGEPFGGEVQSELGWGGPTPADLPEGVPTGSGDAAFEVGDPIGGGPFAGFPAGDGPNPMYVIGVEAIGEAMAVLKALLAAGCHAEAIRGKGN